MTTAQVLLTHSRATRLTDHLKQGEIGEIGIYSGKKKFPNISIRPEDVHLEAMKGVVQILCLATEVESERVVFYWPMGTTPAHHQLPARLMTQTNYPITGVECPIELA